MQGKCLSNKYNFEQENIAASKAALTSALEGAMLETRARA
jgi:hypothetical protein